MADYKIIPGTDGTVALGRKYGLTNAAVGRIVRGIAYVGTRDS